MHAEQDQSSPYLSAVVVVHNEEDNLEACLSTLGFCDAVIVVLDRCTDGSLEIARQYTDKVVTGAWEGPEGPRRHAGLDLVKEGWVLEVDADERVTSALADEILETLRHATTPAHYLVPFDNYVGSRLIRYGWGAYFGVSAEVALFSAGAKKWGNERVHPSVELKGERRHLRERMVHYIDRDISDMLARLDRYSAARARDLRESGDTGTLPRNVMRVFSRFYKCYFRRRGWREGHWGFLIALCAGLYPLLSYLRAQLEDK